MDTPSAETSSVQSPIPSKAVRCVVRLGSERKELLRSASVAETRSDVVSGLHGMGDFRIDYMDERWIIAQEFLTVTVDIERVTAPPKTPPTVCEEITSSDTPQTDALLNKCSAVLSERCLTLASSLPPDKLALLMDEISAIDMRVYDVKQALELYRDAAVTGVEKKFGIGKDRPSNAPKACFEMLQECVAAFPELYAYAPPSFDSQHPDDSNASNASVDPSAQQRAYPRLREHLRTRTLVIVGGMPIPQRMDWVENALGVRPVWMETTPNGNPASVVTSVDHGMRDDKIGAVIIANGLIRHNTFYQLRNSAATRKVPLAYASKCGNGQLFIALGQLERILRQRANESMGTAQKT